MKLKKITNQKLQNVVGSITPALLIITGAFVIVIYGLLFLLTLQLDFSHRQVASENSLNIAEAGINYYMWHLAHDPDDYYDGNGVGSVGPYVHTYSDPQAGDIGEFSLEITPPSGGSSIVTVSSTGHVTGYPRVTRTLTARFGQSSLGGYAFLSNSSVWHGTGATVNGQIHSNTGVRMDGTNTSLVTSSQQTYQCGAETGCHPPSQKAGVWGTGGDQSLWIYPVPPVDFDTISLDLANIKTEAINSGLYLGPLTGNRKKNGYHMIFMSDGTVQVNEVRDTDSVEGYSIPGQGLGQQGIGGCRDLDQLISNEIAIGTYDVADIPVIFVEDDLWVEGDVRGLVTLAIATFPIQSSDVNVWIADNITYGAYDGSDSLGLIAQGDIYFTRDVPNDFQVDAILMAQKGKVIRHAYLDWCGGEEEAIKQKLTVNGSVISFFKSYWNFGTGPESGFIEQELNYDPNGLLNPPPYFPSEGQLEMISLVEEK